MNQNRFNIKAVPFAIIYNIGEKIIANFLSEISSHV